MIDTTEPEASVVDRLREAFDALPDRDRKWTTEIGCNYVGRFRILGISHIQEFIHFIALAHNAMPEILNELEAMRRVAKAVSGIVEMVDPEMDDNISRTISWHSMVEDIEKWKEIAGE